MHKSLETLLSCWAGHRTGLLTASGKTSGCYFKYFHFQNMCRSLRTSSVDGEGLTLEELQVGLCAMDPATPHGSVSGQLRCQFIFRYYNSSGKGFMSFQEFK